MMVLFLAPGLVHSTVETPAPAVTMFRMREWRCDYTDAYRKASSDAPYFDHYGDYKPPFASNQPHI